MGDEPLLAQRMASRGALHILLPPPVGLVAQAISVVLGRPIGCRLLRGIRGHRHLLLVLYRVLPTWERQDLAADDLQHTLDFERNLELGAGFQEPFEIALSRLVLALLKVGGANEEQPVTIVFL